MMNDEGTSRTSKTGETGRTSGTSRTGEISGTGKSDGADLSYLSHRSYASYLSSSSYLSSASYLSYWSYSPPSAVAALPPRGVMHCWAGDLDQARAAIDLGFLLGIGGAVTFPRSTELREVCAAVGLGHLVLETDAPYITPVPHRGKRNEPGYLTHVVECLAGVFGVDGETVRRVTAENAGRLYPRMKVEG